MNDEEVSHIFTINGSLTVSMDAEDHLWVAIWGGGEVRRLVPDGTVAARIPVPGTICNQRGVCRRNTRSRCHHDGDSRSLRQATRRVPHGLMSVRDASRCSRISSLSVGSCDLDTVHSGVDRSNST